MTNNVTELFGKTTNNVEADPVHDYNYRITLKDGTVVNERGYVVINQLFTAIARGEGILYWVRPFSDIQEIVNLGSVAQGTQVN